MNRQFSFDEDAENYDKFRPCYCKELFNDIIEYSCVSKGSNLLEIGIGTGQATKPFLDLGCSVESVELGSKLAKFVAGKYESYNSFSVQNCSFENYNGKNDSFDLIYSATAFHWIPENVGYSKVYDLMKKNGTIALFWNRPFVARDDDPLHCEIQEIYGRYHLSEYKPVENDWERYRKIKESIIRYGFCDVQVKLYHKTRILNADDYISLLNTYSDHSSLMEYTKHNFENEIKNAILKFDNTIKIYDTMDLYLARK